MGCRGDKFSYLSLEGFLFVSLRSALTIICAYTVTHLFEYIHINLSHSHGLPKQAGSTLSSLAMAGFDGCIEMSVRDESSNLKREHVQVVNTSCVCHMLSIFVVTSLYKANVVMDFGIAVSPPNTSWSRDTTSTTGCE